MRHIRIMFGLMLLAGALGSTAMAQVQRTFVSGLASDGNPCTRTAPCRTFAQAISQTNAGGEVYVLDSAGYGPFTINKSISIVAPVGVTAGISVFQGDGIDINAGASDIVILRGLTVNNQGSIGSGIFFNTGGMLHVESCVVNGFLNQSVNTAGVYFAGAGKLEVKDSIMRGNFAGILVYPRFSTVSGTATAAIDQGRLEGNTFGLLAKDGAAVTVRNSVASQNTSVGFIALCRDGGPAELNIENCVASYNDWGIGAQRELGVATVRVCNSTVTDNQVGLENTMGVLLSRGNNTVEGNVNDTVGTIGSYTGK